MGVCDAIGGFVSSVSRILELPVYCLGKILSNVCQNDKTVGVSRTQGRGHNPYVNGPKTHPGAHQERGGNHAGVGGSYQVPESYAWLVCPAQGQIRAAEAAAAACSRSCSMERWSAAVMPGVLGICVPLLLVVLVV